MGLDTPETVSLLDTTGMIQLGTGYWVLGTGN